MLLLLLLLHLAPPARGRWCFRHTRGPKTPKTRLLRAWSSRTPKRGASKPQRGPRNAASFFCFFDGVMVFIFFIVCSKWTSIDGDDGSRAPLSLSRSCSASSWRHPHRRSEMAPWTRSPRPRSVDRPRERVKKEESKKPFHRSFIHPQPLKTKKSTPFHFSARTSPSSPPRRTPAPSPSSTATRAPSSPTRSSTTVSPGLLGPPPRSSRPCSPRSRSPRSSARCRPPPKTTSLPR